MRIRRRLVLYGTGVATLGMAIFIVVIYGLAARGVATDLDRELAARAFGVAAVMGQGDPTLLAAREPLVPADLATSTDEFILVLDPTGRSWYATARLDGEVPRIPAAILVEAMDTGTSVATIRPAPGVELRVAASRFRSGAVEGVAIAGRSTAFTEDQLGGLGFFLILAGLITIVAVAIVSFLVIGRALRPLRTLAATADEIGRTGDLSRRLPSVRTNDEVGVLTASFNGMLDRVEAAQAGLAEALAAQRRFVADASHELRTPLTTVRSNAEFLAEHPDAALADRAEATSDIVAEAERMSRLVDGLLVLARVDAGAGFVHQPVDVASIAADIARKASRAGRPVRATTSGSAVVEGDPDSLARLVWILVDNALTHGGGEVDVVVDGAGEGISLSVADRGPGLPAGDSAALFERFHRADRARSGDGAGLGLAIARSIVDAHGGSISAVDRPDGGAVFTVELPAAP